MKLFPSATTCCIFAFFLSALNPSCAYSQETQPAPFESQEVVDLLSILANLPVKKQNSAPVTDEAQKLYKRHQKAVYQIRVINLSSGKKSTIGSGFQFTKEGHIATNFHVVSEAVHFPKRFKIESLRYDGTIGVLDLKAIDVIHDLAILKTNDGYDEFLDFGDSDFPKGTKVFSLGNPHDLGMSIVEGTYNGLLEKTMYRKIHFSGSLNGGMSGGPAIDNKGHVIGINVATYGNQLSFLVPVDYLKDLYETIKDKDEKVKDLNWNRIIEQQLSKNQAEVIDGIVNSSWESLSMGDAQVPGEMTSLFKCWGDSKDDNEELYQWTSLRCSSQDDIFIAHDLRTGQIIYNYLWITSKGLNPFRFYRVFESSFVQTFQFENAKEEDVENFKCETSFVKLSGENFKAILCARQYKEFPLLFDVNLNMASVDEYKKGLLVELVALGVTKEKSQELIRKFMESIKWTK